MIDLIKCIAIFVAVGFFLTSPAESPETARNELFFIEYVKYANAKNHPAYHVAGENRTLELQLSQISDIDKFKISACVENGGKKPSDVFAEMQIIPLRDAVGIIEETDLRVRNKRDTAIDATEFFDAAEFECILKVSPDFEKTFDALGNTVVYGKNYYIIVEKSESNVKLDICIDREGLAFRDRKEIISKLGGDFSNTEKITSTVSHGITAYSFKSQNGSERFAEFFGSNRLCYLRTVKNLG